MPRSNPGHIYILEDMTLLVALAIVLLIIFGFIAFAIKKKKQGEDLGER